MCSKNRLLASVRCNSIIYLSLMRYYWEKKSPSRLKTDYNVKGRVYIFFSVDDPGSGTRSFLSPNAMLTPSTASAATASTRKTQPNYTNVG